MGEIVIRVEKLGKRFQLGGGTRSDMLKEKLGAGFARLVGRRDNPGPELEDRNSIWAIRDVSFEIKRGEVVGIVGHNGAGKSVLLRILSRITAPTTGRAEVYERVGSLLEIGTGFHPELSGRENIYLNGALLGMRRGEIRARFDEIVEFASVERFLDTPVKHYSSGMALRLAFSVAAHLEAELIFLDEVWALGDAEFQARSLAKMRELVGGGRTVLIVSHNLEQLGALCSRGMLLNQGHLMMDGGMDEIVRRYAETWGSSAA